MKLIWYGTNSIKIIDENNKIIIDPFIRYEKRNDLLFQKFLIEKNVFITHGHIDHTLDIPNLYKNKNSNIYCTKSPYNRLTKYLKKDYLHLIKPNDIIKLNNFDIKIYEGKHIKFDLKLIIKTIFSKDMFYYRNNLIYLIKNHFKCKENNETVIYNIKSNDKNILLMGSMSLCDDIKYPSNVDLLILPYQGKSNLLDNALKIIERIKPKKILLTHFDNSFPPLSKKIDYNALIKKLDKKIEIIIPEYEKEIII